jgi:hypothetical protein
VAVSVQNPQVTSQQTLNVQNPQVAPQQALAVQTPQATLQPTLVAQTPQATHQQLHPVRSPHEGLESVDEEDENESDSSNDGTAGSTRRRRPNSKEQFAATGKGKYRALIEKWNTEARAKGYNPDKAASGVNPWAGYVEGVGMGTEEDNGQFLRVTNEDVLKLWLQICTVEVIYFRHSPTKHRIRKPTEGGSSIS